MLQSSLECIICFQMIDPDKICKNDCGHKFCKNCLDEWINRGKLQCPLCRQTIEYITYQSNHYRLLKPNYTQVSPQYRATIRNALQCYRYTLLFLLGICCLEYYVLHKVSTEKQNLELLYDECKKNITDDPTYTEITSDMKYVELITHWGDHIVGCLIPALFVNRCYQH